MMARRSAWALVALIAAIFSTGPALAQNPFDARVARVRHPSAALGIEKTFYIYVPEEAAADPARRFPAVYLFRGHEREWVNKNEDLSRLGMNVVDVYLDLRREGAVEPLILVFPGITNDSGTVHSVGVNMLRPGGDATLGTGRFEDYIVQDLIPYVDANYPTIADRSARGVDGFSLGAFVSLKLALGYPELFGTAGAFDGLYFLSKKRTPATISDADAAFAASLFDQAFGRPRDVAFASANNPLTMLPNAREEDVRSVRWLIEYGPKAQEPNVNFTRGKRFVKALVAKGGENLLRGPVRGSGHNWGSADMHMRRALPVHSEQLSESPALALRDQLEK